MTIATPGAAALAVRAASDRKRPDFRFLDPPMADSLPPFAADADPAWIASHPRVQRVPSRDLTLFIQRHFLSAEECAGLVERIDAHRRPSTIADATGDGYFRTSAIGRAACRERVCQYV